MLFRSPITKADAVLKSISSLPMVYKVGEKSDYNQTEFLILKMIIENKSGLSYENYLSERIFRPLDI